MKTVFVFFALVAVSSVVLATAPGLIHLYESLGLIVPSVLPTCRHVVCVTESCSENDTLCPVGFYCKTEEEETSSVNETTPIDPICTEGKELGSPCSSNAECGDKENSGYICDPIKNVCVRGHSTGDVCDANITCLFPASCGASGRCENPYTLGEMSTCDPASSVPNSGCFLSLYCASDNLCRPLPGLDEACDLSVGCRAPYSCNGTDLICVDPMMLPEGAACMSAVDCEEGLFCSANGKCTKVPETRKLGVSCTKDSDCDAASFCGCSFVRGYSVCLTRAISSQDLLDSFESAVVCAEKDANLDLRTCQKEKVAVQNAANASLLLDRDCTRDLGFIDDFNSASLAVPVVLMTLILIVILLVKLGNPAES